MTIRASKETHNEQLTRGSKITNDNNIEINSAWADSIICKLLAGEVFFSSLFAKSDQLLLELKDIVPW